jgi:7-carboxy-7-deazaguanine synthase
MADFEAMSNIMSKQPQLSWSECFGPTLQGEGKYIGKQAYFIRLGLCNLDCKWCDTPYTWDWTGKNGYKYSKSIELRRSTVSELAAKVPATCQHVVLTGGEPMLQQTALFELASLLRERGHTVEIETNGTIKPKTSDWLRLAQQHSDLGVQFNVSPKLGNSGVAWEIAINQEALLEYKQLGAIFKFVTSNDDDLAQVAFLQNALELPSESIYLMPEGRTQEEILAKLPELFGVCAVLGYVLTPRLHVLAFNDKRGI